MSEFKSGETVIILNILYTLHSDIIKYKRKHKVEIDNEKNFEFINFESLINNIITKLEKNISYYEYHYECDNSYIKELMQTYRKVIEE